MLVAPPVATPLRAHLPGLRQRDARRADSAGGADPLERVGLPEPPPWRREPEYEPATPGDLRIHGFTSKPEIQKLNRNSIFIFVNGRLIRDKVVMHGILEGYRNILPPTVYPVVLLFLEMPCTEVDVNVHPSKTEVRFRQQSFVHDFVRDAVRSALMAARPAPAFASEIHGAPSARVALTPPLPGSAEEAFQALAELRAGGPRQLRQSEFFGLFADCAAACAAQ